MANAARAEKVVETILAGKTVATVPLGRLGIANGSPLIATRGIIHLDWGPAFSSPFPPGSSHVSLPHPLFSFLLCTVSPQAPVLSFMSLYSSPLSLVSGSLDCSEHGFWSYEVR